MRIPSRKKSRGETANINLIPILDAVFIFIFFLLMSTKYIKIFEIQSYVPRYSSNISVKKKKPPLSLVLMATSRGLTLYSGNNAEKLKYFPKNGLKYAHDALHNFLVLLKLQHTDERSIVFEPRDNVSYEDLISIMDSVRTLRSTDPSIYTKDSAGLEVKVDVLFNDIIFGNIQG